MKKKYVVVDNATGIPLGSQPYYTLQQAVDRLGREEKQAMTLFPEAEKNEIRKLFGILDTESGEYVL